MGQNLNGSEDDPDSAYNKALVKTNSGANPKF